MDTYTFVQQKKIITLITIGLLLGISLLFYRGYLQAQLLELKVQLDTYQTKNTLLQRKESHYANREENEKQLIQAQDMLKKYEDKILSPQKGVEAVVYISELLSATKVKEQQFILRDKEQFSVSESGEEYLYKNPVYFQGQGDFFHILLLFEKLFQGKYFYKIQQFSLSSGTEGQVVLMMELEIYTLANPKVTPISEEILSPLKNPFFYEEVIHE